MEQVCAKRVYDSWQQVERMLRQTRDRGMKVTLPKVTIQQENFDAGNWLGGEGNAERESGSS